MRHGSLFSGIGGFDLAAEWMGWENVFHCEINDFCQKVLKYYWPNSISYADITKTDFSIWRGRIDIITGGFPCQPYSQAGRRKGKEDDRHLWPEMLRAIREIQPSWIVGENVFGLLNWNRGLVFHEVQTDLEAAGFVTFPYVLPACSVNAPHRRDRVWIIAYSDSNGFVGGNSENEINASKRGEYALNDIEPVRDATNSKCIRQQRSWWPKGQMRSKENGNWEASWANPNGGWPTQPPVRIRDDGFPAKLVRDSLSAAGNAIVPQIAYEIFKTIEQYEQTIQKET